MFTNPTTAVHMHNAQASTSPVGAVATPFLGLVSPLIFGPPFPPPPLSHAADILNHAPMLVYAPLTSSALDVLTRFMRTCCSTAGVGHMITHSLVRHTHTTRECCACVILFLMSICPLGIFNPPPSGCGPACVPIELAIVNLLHSECHLRHLSMILTNPSQIPY